MKRLGEIIFTPDSVDKYGTDSLCQVLTPPGLVPNLDSNSVYAVRMIFKPAWNPEFVVTLKRKPEQFEYSIHSARISLWQFLNWGADPRRIDQLMRDELLPPQRWESNGVLGIGEIPSCVEHADEFSDVWQFTPGALVLDGTAVDTCRIDATGSREFRCPGATRWNTRANEFWARVPFALTRDSVDEDVIDLLNGAPRYSKD